jgi:hypothetical protein
MSDKKGIIMATTPANTTELIAKAVEIAGKRRQTLSALRDALDRHDDQRALQLARKYCGLANDKKSNRVN